MFKEAVVRIERGMKMQLRAICIRQSRSTVGSELIENVADSVMETLVRGMGRTRGACWFDRGAIVIGGNSLDWTLLMRTDQLLGVKVS